MKLFISFLIIFFAAFFSLAAFPFVPGAGAKPSAADRADYAKRAANFDGKKFHNLENDGNLMAKVKDEDPARLSKNATRPASQLPARTPAFLKNPSQSDLTVTWFGHSSLLIQMHGMNILFDPVFSKRISPVQWIGPKRFFTPTITLDELPEIDILILTHDHYDHLDYPAIKKLDPKVKQYIVPLGVECHLKKWKIAAEKITNTAWWEQLNINGLEITATPARHFSGRWLTTQNTTLWNSYVLKDEYHQIFESGDSGYGEHFKTIHEKFGDFDLALMECGQYNKRWPSIHSFPEETAKEAAELGAKLAMPIHWGAIVLSTNGWDDSVLRFTKAAKEINLNYITPYLCQTVDFSHSENAKSYSEYRDEWWK